MSYLYYKAINWDEIEDNFDKYAWEQLTSNFWLDIRIPVTNDKESWERLLTTEKQQMSQLLASASLLACLQSEFGTPMLRGDKRTQQEEAVLNTVTFMKSVHAKSCTTVFRTLLTVQQSKEAFHFADYEPNLQKETEQLIAVFQSGTALQKKAVFILTEIGLSVGKYYPILKRANLANLEQLVFNILRGSAIFCAYIGYKFRLDFSELENKQQEQIKRWVETFFSKLITIETAFLTANDHENQDLLNLCYWGTNYSLNLLGMEPVYSVKKTPFIEKLEHIFIDQNKFSQQVAAASNEVDTEDMTDDDYDF
ncbi:MAG: ribonucleotide-diphosphate reductase subunit beta [Liquorilactobacillus hordei]|uniref:Ribonucleoside-diphosphate reductase n=1 Tax=Liquorilactobacillus hordei TaxID=468911 RepID=A0A3Q8CMT9_9LACO|nr:ribonucleotide-diphosphate reductase subunit beta [Liquorilactobacillus hordei]AUJ30780.1 ribonucleoside-diphosphate reductase [Liquorilactobacillus hordei]MBZ2406073.1 ribonucleoside-diphosphate reductase [Liquorilactobacillus hordei]